MTRANVLLIKRKIYNNADPESNLLLFPLLKESR